ncbi:hypothetical protein VPH35_059382 [Triticum aestivum]
MPASSSRVVVFSASSRAAVPSPLHRAQLPALEPACFHDPRSPPEEESTHERLVRVPDPVNRPSLPKPSRFFASSPVARSSVSFRSCEDSFDFIHLSSSWTRSSS